MNFSKEPMAKITVNLPKEVAELRRKFEQHGIGCFEADIRFAYRFLIDNGIKGIVDIDGQEKDGDDRVDVIFEEPVLKLAQRYNIKLKALSMRYF